MFCTNVKRTSRRKQKQFLDGSDLQRWKCMKKKECSTSRNAVSRVVCARTLPRSLEEEEDKNRGPEERVTQFYLLFFVSSKFRASRTSVALVHERGRSRKRKRKEGHEEEEIFLSLSMFCLLFCTAAESGKVSEGPREICKNVERLNLEPALEKKKKVFLQFHFPLAKRSK